VIWTKRGLIRVRNWEPSTANMVRSNRSACCVLVKEMTTLRAHSHPLDSC
jgi:hypothetical protein